MASNSPRRPSAKNAIGVAALLAIPRGAPPADPVLTFNGAAARLGISSDKLRLLMNRGEGPLFAPVNGKKMFRASTLDKWLAKQERDSAKVLRANAALVAKFGGAKIKNANGERRSPVSRSVTTAEGEAIARVIRRGAATRNADPKTIAKSWDNAIAAARRPRETTAADATDPGWDAAFRKARGPAKPD